MKNSIAMKCSSIIFVLPLLLAAAPAPAQVPDMASVPQQLRINLAWQVALEAADFSPGVLDGVFKRKSLQALTEFAARYFPGLTPYDERVYRTLQVDVDRALTAYTITPDDAAQVGGPLPDDWNEKSQLRRLNYESLADAIAEKFHCTRALLETLNPGL